MSKNEIKSLCIQSECIGRLAFLNNELRVPATNKNLMNLLTGLKVGSGSSDIMKSFLYGWDSENFKEPVEIED